MEAGTSVRRRSGSCRASNPLDRYKDTTPFPVQHLINNDWQSRRCEKSAGVVPADQTLWVAATPQAMASQHELVRGAPSGRSAVNRGSRCIPVSDSPASWSAEWIKAAPPPTRWAFKCKQIVPLAKRAGVTCFPQLVMRSVLLTRRNATPPSRRNDRRRRWVSPPRGD